MSGSAGRVVTIAAPRSWSMSSDCATAAHTMYNDRQKVSGQPPKISRRDHDFQQIALQPLGPGYCCTNMTLV